MANTTKYETRKALMDYYVYAPLGAGQLVIEKVRELPAKAWMIATDQRRSMVKAYKDLAERGEKIVKGIGKAPYSARAIEQTKTARTKVKAAARKVS